MKLFILCSRIWNYILLLCYRPLLKMRGSNVKFFPRNSIFSYSRIEIGSDVYIGPGAHFSSICLIKIGNKVLFGPNVTIITGDHRFDVIGKFMFDIKEKRKIDDQPVIIEDDVWVGANVTILKGVTVGRGSIIAANSLVIKEILPYTVNAGSPSKPLKLRWNIEDILEHEKVLYKTNKRYLKEVLLNLYSNTNLIR